MSPLRSLLSLAILACTAAGSPEDHPRRGLFSALRRRLKFGYHGKVVPTCPPLGGVTEEDCPEAPELVPSCETPNLPDGTICSTVVGDSCDLSFTECVYDVGGVSRRLQEESPTPAPAAVAPTPSGELVSIGKIGGEEVTASPTPQPVKYCPDEPGVDAQPTKATRSLPVPRIVGGDTVSIKEYPWQVALTDEEGGFCGGSIIADSWVLTAAHCVSAASPTKIRAGSTLQYSGFGTSSGQEYDVEQILVHPSYLEFGIPVKAWTGDSALIKIVGTFDFDTRPDRIGKIDLITEREVALGYQDAGVTAYATGWGDVESTDTNPNRLQMASFPIVANDVACHRDGATDANGDFGQYSCSSIDDSMIVAGVLAGGKDSCQGDSGGPLAIQVEGRWLLVGVTSWGNGCADVGYPGVYSRVSAHLDFIKQHVPELFCPDPLQSKDPCTLQCEDDSSLTLPPSPLPTDPMPSGDPTISHAPTVSSAPTFLLDPIQKTRCLANEGEFAGVTDYCRICCADCVPFNSNTFQSSFTNYDFTEASLPGDRCACLDLEVDNYGFTGLGEAGKAAIHLTDRDDCIRVKGDVNLVFAHGGDDAVAVLGDLNVVYGDAGTKIGRYVEGHDAIYARGEANVAFGDYGDDTITMAGVGGVIAGEDGNDVCTDLGENYFSIYSEYDLYNEIEGVISGYCDSCYVEETPVDCDTRDPFPSNAPTLSFAPTHRPSISSAPTSTFSPTHPSIMFSKEEKMQCFRNLPPFEDVADYCASCCAECTAYNSETYASTFYTTDYYEFQTPVDLGGQCACLDLDSVRFDANSGVRTTDEADCIRLSALPGNTDYNFVATHGGDDVVYTTGGYTQVTAYDGSDYVIADGPRNIVDGQEGADTLELIGPYGTIYGGGGDDTCTYDDEADTLTQGCEACFDSEGGTLQCAETYSCFPADVTVQLADGTTKPMCAVQLGDAVLDAGGEYSTVYAFGHAQEDVVAAFVELVLTNGLKLALSPDHYLAANGGLVYAKHVRPGDEVGYVAAGLKYPAAGPAAFARGVVASTAKITKRGLYNPYTLSGTIVVDGVVASCHSSWILDGLLPPRVAAPVYQALFGAGRLAYAVFGPRVCEAVGVGNTGEVVEPARATAALFAVIACLVGGVVVVGGKVVRARA